MKLALLLLLATATAAELSKDYLIRTACVRNPHLDYCVRAREERMLAEAKRREEKRLIAPARDEVPTGKVDDPFTAIETRDKVKKHEEKKLSPEDEALLKAKCTKIAPIAAEHCQKNRIRKGSVQQCVSYFRDCGRFFRRNDPLYDIAHAFDMGVRLNFATVDVNGIPYYPINEEGSVGVSVGANIPFGSWGGGYSDHVGVRDYWSSHREMGANWYEGKYGYKSGWSVPLVQSLGIEGEEHHTAHVPLDPEHIGNIQVDNGGSVGGYYGHNDRVKVNWREGDVAHTFGVGVPFAGVGFNTGQAVTFPSLDTFMNAGRKKRDVGLGFFLPPPANA